MSLPVSRSCLPNSQEDGMNAHVPPNRHDWSAPGPQLILKTPTLQAKRIGPRLIPDCSRVLLRPFHPSSVDIARRIVARVMALSDGEVAALLSDILNEFAGRHENVEKFFRSRFAQVNPY